MVGHRREDLSKADLWPANIEMGPFPIPTSASTDRAALIFEKTVHLLWNFLRVFAATKSLKLGLERVNRMFSYLASFRLPATLLACACATACADEAKRDSHGSAAGSAGVGLGGGGGASNSGTAGGGAAGQPNAGSSSVAGTTATVAGASQGGAAGSSIGSAGASAGGGAPGGLGGAPSSAGGAGGAGAAGSANGGASLGGIGGIGGGAAGSSGASASSGRGGAAGSTANAGSGGNAGGAGASTTVLGATPPMGWNSWNTFTSQVSESLIKQVADALVSSGMASAGYVYVNIDDTWSAMSRNSSGKLVSDATRFPSGIQALADYVHGKGLKLGIYSDRGDKTCAGYPGSYNHETDDANTWASWGVDYVKYDNCYIPAGRENDPQMKDDYTKMGNALKATGRPILYSICAWWFHDWMPSVGHIWRTTTDIQATWNTDEHSILSLLDKNGGDTSRYGDASYGPPGIAQYAGPGHYNDPDMLEVGVGSLTEDENKAHFSMWAMMAAPLIAGNDVRSMSASVKAILTNAEVIAVDQDALGKQGKPISTSTTLEVWSKQLSGTNRYAVALLNRTESAATINVTWSSLGLTGAATVRDLWSHTDLGSMPTGYSASVPKHGVVMLTVSGQ